MTRLPYIDHYADPVFMSVLPVPRPEGMTPEPGYRMVAAEPDETQLPRFRVRVRIVADEWDSFDTIWRDVYRLALLSADRVGMAPEQCISEHEVRAASSVAAIGRVLHGVAHYDQDGFDVVSAEPLDFPGPMVMWTPPDDGNGFRPMDCCSAAEFDRRMAELRDAQEAGDAE